MSRKQTARQPAAVVYCGPTVRGVAKQFQVFQNGTPLYLRTLGERIPEVRALTVTLDKFAATRQALQNGDSIQSLLYARICRKLRTEMNKED